MKQKDTLHNPWAGLASYEDPAKSTRKLKFCGRDSETFDVSRLIDDNFFVTLYGKSGIGKTSLLNAGVFPALRREQYTPISLRLGMTDVSQSFQDIITQTIERSVLEDGGVIHLIPVVEEETDCSTVDYLWNWFARRRFLTANGQITFPVVVFDQFEEVFRHSESRTKTEVLLKQLHYLIDDSHAVSDCIVNGEEYTYDFNFRFVLSIREDDLYRLEDSIDNCSLTALKRCRYRLRSLSEQGAREAVLIPGEGLFRPEEQDGIVRTIIGIARNKEDQNISTNLLSLVCSRIFVEFQKKPEADSINQSLVDTFVKGNPFERFYDEATKGFSNKEKSYIEEHLVDSTGRRNSMPESDFLLHVPNGAKLLEGDTRILQRSSVSTDGGNYRIELIHDSFCEPLSKQREKREKRKRVRMFMAAVGVALLCLGIAATIFFLVNSNRSQKGTIAKQDEDLVLMNEQLKLTNKQLEEKKDSVQLRAQQLAEALKQIDEKNTALEKEKEIALLSAKQLAMAFGQVDEKNQELEETILTLNENRSRYIAEKAKDLVQNGDSYLACMIALEALDLCQTPEAEAALRNARQYNSSVLKGHSSTVWSVEFSPDGKQVTSTGSDAMAYVWDVSTGIGTRIEEITSASAGDQSCFSPDGKQILTVGSEVKVFDARSLHLIKVLDIDDFLIESAAYSPDGKKIYVSTYERILIFDASSFKLLSTIDFGDTYLTKHSFSPDGKRLCYFERYSDKEPLILDVGSGKICLVIPDHDITAMSFSPDGELVATATISGIIRLWDDQSGILKKELTVGDYVADIAFSPNGRHIASASWDGVVRLWDVPSGNLLKEFYGHENRVLSLSFNPDGNLLASSSWDNTIRIWDLDTIQPIVTKITPSYDRKVYQSPDGKKEGIVSWGKPVKIIDRNSEKVIFQLPEDTWQVHTLDFSPDNKTFVTSSQDYTTRIWDAATGEERMRFEHDEIVYTAVFSPNGNYIAAGDGVCLRIWNVKTGQQEMIINSPPRTVYSLAYDPSGIYLAALLENGTLRVYDTRDWITVLEYKVPSYVGDKSKVVFEYSRITVYSYEYKYSWDFPPLQDLIDETRKRFKDRQLTPEERKKYYLD